MKRSCTIQLTFRLPQHVCGALLLLVLWLRAAPAQEPLSWPNRPPYVRLWTGKEVVLMPTDAARAVRRCLKDVPPKDWGVLLGPLPSDAEHPRQVVQLVVDGAEAHVGFLATSYFWNLLNDQNAASLNQALEQLGRDLVASGLDDEGKQRAYLERLDEVVLGMSIHLDDRFVSWYFTAEGDRADWLKGREKSADALLGLCHNVTITRQGKEVAFTYNSLLYNGSVVRRTIHVQVAGRWLELLRLETVELRKAGMFSYAHLI